jgi:hypothetical protein
MVYGSMKRSKKQSRNCMEPKGHAFVTKCIKIDGIFVDVDKKEKRNKKL